MRHPACRELASIAYALVPIGLAVCMLATGTAWADSCPDADTDGFADCRVPACETTGVTCGDCNDADPGVNPDVPETCNHRDDNCDGSVDEGSEQVISVDKEVGDDARQNERFGWALARVPDMTGDGVPEIAASAPGAPSERGVYSGIVRILSGADRTEVCRVVSDNRAELGYLGTSVANVGDLTGDGIDDFAAGQPGLFSDNGEVHVYSGADCTRWATWRDRDSGIYDTESFGAAIAVIGDINRDSIPDVAIGAPTTANRLGSVLVYSGQSTAGVVVLRLYHPAGGTPRFGVHVAGVGDVNRDGRPDIAIAGEFGAPIVFSGMDGSVIRFLETPEGGPNDYLLALPDLDGDNIGEIAAGGSVGGGGGINIYSGADGSLVEQLTDPDGDPGDGLGHSIATLPDVDGDGVVEIVAGIRDLDVDSADQAGGVLVFGSSDWTVLHRLTDPAGAAEVNLGHSVLGMPDLSGDGIPDVVAGAPYDDGAGEVDTGSVVVFAVESDCDRDGQGPLAGDCNDHDLRIGTGFPEVCDALDNDCDDGTDEDEDGDGVGVCDDCDPFHRGVHPGAVERCDGLDNDCDGLVDDGPDSDGDGQAAPCDCNDSSSSVHPGAAEGCNYTDDDCDGAVDESHSRTVTTIELVDPDLDPEARGRLGFALAALGDLNGDGRRELIAGEPFAERAFVFSGADGSVYCRVDSPSPSETLGFGTSVADVGDITGDGVSDFAIGAPYDRYGAVRLYSGADCTDLFRFYGQIGDRLGSSAIATLPDVTGDGVQEIAVGVPVFDLVWWQSSGGSTSDFSDAGAVKVFSGADGASVSVILDPHGFIGDELGVSLDEIGDVDGDGVRDLAVGARDSTVRFFSGADHSLIRRTHGEPSWVGNSLTATDDITGDGIPDVVVGHPGAFSVAVFSGADGGYVRSHPIQTSRYAYTALESIEDLDGDETPEILVGVRPTSGPGFALILSGANGIVRYNIQDPAADESSAFGYSVASPGDLNSDGFPEFAVGAPHESTLSPDAGSVFLFSIESDCDDDEYGRFGGDCDDTDADANPGVVDVCDGSEQDDCVPGDGTGETWIDLPCDGLDTDVCREGVFLCITGERVCDDLTSDNLELCNDLDDDCNGWTDDPACPFYDVDGDDEIGGMELAWLGRAFGACSADPSAEWWGAIEYTGDGCVDGEDLVVLANLWFATCSGGELICE